MPERYEVEPVPHDVPREGDTLLKDMNPPTAKKITRIEPGPHGGLSRYDFADGDWLVTAGWVLRVVPLAARVGTEDELADAACGLLDTLEALQQRADNLKAATAYHAAKRRLRAALAARAASTPEEDGEVFSNRPGWPRPATDL